MMNSTTASPIVSITGLSKQFGETQALRDIDLTVTKGEVVVLLGRSGSGKSTLLRHIDGLDVPSQGEVTVLGRSVSTLKSKELRQLRGQVAMIFQQFELVPSLTVLENVLTGALARVKGPRLGLSTWSTSLKREALAHLDRVGLLDRTYSRADMLSGGQQQRVAIARALMQNPEVLLADEPVASLDPESSDVVMRLIREIGTERGLTVICSLHQVDIALGWGDRIVGLRHGKVVLDTPAGNLSKAEVMKIYGSVISSTAELTAIETELSDISGTPSVAPAYTDRTRA
jgi:phosphonate transport system ATP-binding protein